MISLSTVYVFSPRDGVSTTVQLTSHKRLHPPTVIHDDERKICKSSSDRGLLHGHHRTEVVTSEQDVRPTLDVSLAGQMKMAYSVKVTPIQAASMRLTKPFYTSSFYINIHSISIRQGTGVLTAAAWRYITDASLMPWLQRNVLRLVGRQLDCGRGCLIGLWGECMKMQPYSFNPITAGVLSACTSSPVWTASWRGTAKIGYKSVKWVIANDRRLFDDVRSERRCRRIYSSQWLAQSTRKTPSGFASHS